MVQVSKPLVIAGVSAVAAAALLAFALARGSSSSSAKKQSAAQQDGVREVPNLHKEQLLSILETICTQMGQVVMQLAKLEAKIRQESSQSGRSLPEDQLASYLMGQFEEAMKAIEAQVYAKFQTTEDEVKVATEYFEEDGDKDVANAVAKLQELYRVMTGGGFSDVEVPAELTLAKFIAIMQETMESLNVAMEEVCLEVKELNPDNKEEAINQRYVKRADNLSAEIHAKHGLTREVLQAAMMKYQQEPAFLMAMTELQQQQAERFAAAAAIFNGEVNMGLTE
ncbi:Dehydrogenase/reductase SDR family member 13 [Phytophthora cinnamomi]|uniref:Dehydrogenase/reductase SDR family member 13 n=1 Tax=Phytophthora cinnamomi TaxID=4785 RepID=UPI003559C765|nr:Dehydrogenase/reductase SDR family member 13 [Phytophthora cinnamomi]